MNLDDVWSVIVAVSVRCDHALDNARMTATVSIHPHHGSLTDREQSPGNGSGTSGIALLASESVRGRGRLEEDEGKEDKGLGPETGLVLVRIDAKGFKRAQDDEDDGPWRVSRARKPARYVQPW